MRNRSSAFLALFLCAGCTHTQLRQSSLQQASSLTDLQQEQVMGNLAMFTCNPHSLPWHIKLSGGLIQVSDQGTAGFMANFKGMGAPSEYVPSLEGQRGILEQWSVEPATDPDDLELLQVAYRKAVDPANPEVYRAILEKICELSVRFDLLPSEETIRQILLMENDKGQAGRDTMLKIIDGLCKTLKDLGGKTREHRLRQILVLSELIGVAPEQRCMELLEKKKDGTPHYPELQNLRSTWGLEADGPHEPSSPNVTVNLLALGRRQEASMETGRLILTAMHEACPPGYLPPTDLKWETGRGYVAIDQAEDKIRKLEELLTKPQFQVPWLRWGCKKDVPECACYVGHHRDCHGDRYVWVTPNQAEVLKDFTLIVLALAPAERPEFPAPEFPAYSPTLGR